MLRILFLPLELSAGLFYAIVIIYHMDYCGDAATELFEVATRTKGTGAKKLAVLLAVVCVGFMYKNKYTNLAF